MLLRYCSWDGSPIDKQKRGRKRISTVLEDCQLLAAAKLNRTEPLKNLARLFRDGGGPDLSTSTVWRRLDEFKGRTVTAVWDDLSDENKAGRMAHCTKMKAIMMTEPDELNPYVDNNLHYNSVIFSDEVMFTLHNG